MRSRSRGRVSNLIEYESPEQPPPITPRRRPPSSGDTPSLAMATRIFFTARSVTCKAWPGAIAVAIFGGAAAAPSAGFDSIFTKFDILPFQIQPCGGVAPTLRAPSLRLFLAQRWETNVGCPTLATFLFLWLGWDRAGHTHHHGSFRSQV